MDEQHPVTWAIRGRVDAHEGTGSAQWYVDEHSIDCDADEFWAVADEAVRASLTATDEPRGMDVVAAAREDKEMARRRQASPPKSVPPLTGMPPVVTGQAADIVTEYGQRLSSGGYQTWNIEPYVEEIYPLARKIENERRHGKVYRRRIIVIEEWGEVDAP